MSVSTHFQIKLAHLILAGRSARATREVARHNARVADEDKVRLLPSPHREKWANEVLVNAAKKKPLVVTHSPL